MAGTNRISRSRRELLANYATAAGNLYGIISIDELADLFNSYENPTTDTEELQLALEMQNKSNLNYMLLEDWVIGFHFSLTYHIPFDTYAVIRKAQEDKPRYLPDKDEFLRYVNSNYFEPKKPYDDLATYLQTHMSETNNHDVKGDILKYRAMIQIEDTNPSSEVEFFTDRDYSFKKLDDLNAFLQKLMEFHNNTRMFQNNGFTPIEAQAWMPQFLSKLPEDTLSHKESDEEMFAKVGRNDLCPCGSGKKYKHCHGSETPPKNKLSVSDTEHFYRLWYSVIAYVNKKFHLVPGIQRDLEQNNYKTIDGAKIQRARDKIWEMPALISEFIDNDDAKLTDEDRDILLDWQNKHIKSNFMLVKHLKDYSVFMQMDEENENSVFYGVLGQMTPIERMFPRAQLPLMVDAVLLPFKGKIVHDSLIAKYSMSFGSGAMALFENTFADHIGEVLTTIK